MTGAEGPVDLVVTVASGHLGRIDAVVDELRAAGLDHLEVLRAVGVVTGRARDAAAAGAAAEVSGVDAVEVSRAVGVPPPDEPLQ